MGTLLTFLIIMVFSVISPVSFAGEKIFKFNVDSLKKPSLISPKSYENSGIPLPNGKKIFLKRKEIEFRKDGFTWYGIVKGFPESLVVITVENGIAYGKIKLDKKEYNIEPFSIEKNLYKIKDFSEKEVIPFGDDFVPAKRLPYISPKNIKPLTTQFEDGSQVDILLLYTAELEQKLGNALKTELRHLVDLGNTVLKNSNINTRLNIVGIEKFDTTDINESVDTYSSLRNLARSTAAKNLRDKYKADIVTLFRVFKGSNVCGMGYTPLGLPDDLASNLNFYTSALKDTSFNVVNIGSYGYSYCPDFTFIHEVGHNFGCEHDRDHAGNGGAYSYSYGYDIPDVFATVMSYDKPTIYYFSNPNITYKGYPIGKPEGDPEEADNSKTINKTRILVANYIIRSSNQNTAPYITVYPQEINFGKVVLNKTVYKTLKITNTGDNILKISSIKLSGNSEFSIKDNSCAGNSLDNGKSCQIEISFTPIKEGIKEASLTIYSNAKNSSSLQVLIKGEGKAPQPPTIIVNNKVLDFGKVENKSSKTKTVYIENISSDETLSLSFEIPYSDDFKVINNCGKSLSPSYNCNVDVVFNPQTVGNKKYSFFIKTNDPKNPRVEIDALGESVPRPGKLSIDLSYIDFGKVYIGEEKRKKITLRNVGDLTLKILSLETDNPVFNIEKKCPYIFSNGSCDIEVSFIPLKNGKEKGNLIIKTSNSTKKIPLYGEGVEKPAPKIFISDNDLDFGTVLVGKQIKKKIFIENKGNVDLKISSVSTNAKEFQLINTCNTISPNDKCYIEVVFNPKNEGTFESKLIIKSNDPKLPVYYVTLKGIGKIPKKPEISIDTNNINIGSIFQGNIVKKHIQIKNKGNDILKIKSIYTNDKNISVEKPCSVVQPNEVCEVILTLNTNKIGSFSSFIYIETNDPVKPKIQIPITYEVKEKPKPIIEQLPPKITFGSTYIGEEKEKYITLKNIGNAPLEIKEVAFENGKNFLIRNSCIKVNPQEECRVQILFKPREEGLIKDNLVIKTNIGIFTVKLAGVGKKKKSQINVSSEKIDFGSIYINETKKASLYIRNIGKAPLKILGLRLEGSSFFSIKHNCQVIDPTKNCKIDILFSPKKEGNYEGKLLITTDNQEKPKVVITLKGTAKERPKPLIEGLPDEITFKATYIGEIEKRKLTLKNLGNAILKINEIKLEDENSFSVKTNCNDVKPQEKCDIQVSFKPKKEGLIESKLILKTNAGVVYISLKGIGKKKKSRVYITSQNINFGEIFVNEVKKASFYIENKGNAPLKILGLRFEGSEFFSFKPSCQIINPEKRCKIDVVFSPKREGSFSGKIYIETDNEEKQQIVIAVKGSAKEKPKPDIYIEKQFLDFGKVEIGKKIEKNLNIFNKGNKPLKIQKAILKSNSFQLKNTCAVIEPNNKCSLVIVFKPNTVGSITSQLEIHSDDPDTPVLKVSLKGTGLEKKEPKIKISTEKVDFGNVLVDDSKTKRIYIKNIGNELLKIENITINDLENFSINSNCPKNLEPDKSCYVDITFSPKKEGKIETAIKIKTNVVNGGVGNVNVKGHGVYISQEEADINNDGKITKKDLEEFINIVLEEVKDSSLDLNGDNQADISDIILLLRKIKGGKDV